MVPDNIVRSTIPPFEYPQQPFGKYLQTQICTEDSDKIVLVIFILIQVFT